MKGLGRRGRDKPPFCSAGTGQGNNEYTNELNVWCAKKSAGEGGECGKSVIVGDAAF